jgi:hypothetical protein
MSVYQEAFRDTLFLEDWLNYHPEDTGKWDPNIDFFNDWEDICLNHAPCSGRCLDHPEDCWKTCIGTATLRRRLRTNPVTGGW